MRLADFILANREPILAEWIEAEAPDLVIHSGDVSLDGLKFAVTVSFPGPLHEGNGEAQALIDEKATPEQREALLRIANRCPVEQTLARGIEVVDG